MEWLGRIPYSEGLRLQEDAVAARRRGVTGDRLLLLEHPPVVTFGRSGRAEHLLVGAAELARRGVEVHHVARGGDVTYHAPGQLVGYPIVDLAARGAVDLPAFLRALEAGLVDACEALGVPAAARPGVTGVFVAEEPRRKLASIGIGVRGWVSCHGFALNVDLDLEGFSVIVPCGLHDVEMTSVARELGGSAPDLMRRAREAVAAALPPRLAG